MNSIRRFVAIGFAHLLALVAGAATANAYTTIGYSWSAKGANYYASNWYPSAFLTAIQSADATWEGAGSSFTFTYKGTTTRNATLALSGTTDGYNVIGYGNLGSTGAVAKTAITGTKPNITEADTAINSTYYYFTTIGTAGYYDMQDTMTHEFGHWLWLSDQYSASSPYYCDPKTATSTEATMCGYSIANDTYRRSLRSDDQNGIKALYP